MVTIAANQGLRSVNDVLCAFRLLCMLGKLSSRKLSFEAKVATNSSRSSGTAVNRPTAGRRRHTGGANLNIPLSFGNGSSVPFGG